MSFTQLMVSPWCVVLGAAALVLVMVVGRRLAIAQARREARERVQRRATATPAVAPVSAASPTSATAPHVDFNVQVIGLQRVEAAQALLVRAGMELQTRLAAQGQPGRRVFAVPGPPAFDPAVLHARGAAGDYLRLDNPDGMMELGAFDVFMAEFMDASRGLTAIHLRVAGCAAPGVVFVELGVRAPEAGSDIAIDFEPGWADELPVYYGSDLDRGEIVPVEVAVDFLGI